MKNDIELEEMTQQDGEQLVCKYFQCFVPLQHKDLN